MVWEERGRGTIEDVGVERVLGGLLGPRPYIPGEIETELQADNISDWNGAIWAERKMTCKFGYHNCISPNIFSSLKSTPDP